MARQLAAALSTTGQGRTDIYLEPRELGRVSLSLVTSDAGVSVAIAAERPETADLIRRNLDALSGELRDIGYDQVSYDFLGTGQDRTQDDSREVGESVFDDAPEGADTDEPAAHETVRPNASLDIRL
ncbi:flagellar hook-length control protein FliK [Histidinibacterium aquaticum]|nr:flagellar hook-length control protein FliK [Histidinibacterium aquaticum]